MADHSLPRVLWLGGSPCAGKSTIATQLAERHGLLLYSCDVHFDRHSAAADLTAHPKLTRMRVARRGEVFLGPLDALVRDELAACRELFSMVAADLAALATDRLVLAEGMALLPECVATLRPQPPRAAWLVPVPAFQRAHYGKRPWAASLVASLAEPARAFENWMRRDEVSARWVRRQAHRLGLPLLVVDDRHSLSAVTGWVEQRLGLAQETG